jgi:hypothetical protein
VVETFIERQPNTVEVMSTALTKVAGNTLRAINSLKNRVEVKVALSLAMLGLLTACGAPISAAPQPVDTVVGLQPTLTPFLPGVEPTADSGMLTNLEGIVPVQSMKGLQIPPTAETGVSVQAPEQAVQQAEPPQNDLFTNPECQMIRPGDFDEKAAEGARQAKHMMADVINTAAIEFGLSQDQVDHLKAVNIKPETQKNNARVCRYVGGELGCAPDVLISDTTNALLAHEFMHLLMAELGFSPSGLSSEFMADLYMGSEFPDTHRSEINKLDIANCTGSNYLWTGIDGMKMTIQQILMALREHGVTDDLIAAYIMSGGKDSSTLNYAGISIDSVTSQWFGKNVTVSAWWNGDGLHSLDPSLYYDAANLFRYKIYQAPPP